jgi:hypothetical protein
MSDEFVITPGGLRRKSLVHHIPEGTYVDGSEGRLRHMRPSGEVLADFGPLEMRPAGRALMPANIVVPPAEAPTLGSGWITYATWTNASANAVSRFTTTWTVPQPPETQSGQVIFLFNGIQNSTMIYQPVLQWGPSAAGGGDYWAVACWYADGQNGHSTYSSLVQVNPGETLVGVMTLTGQGPQGYSYNCVFQGISGATLAIQNVEQLTDCVETLECYYLTRPTDYPNADMIDMQAIEMATGNTTPALAWAAVDAVTDIGQHTIVVSDSTANGSVELFFDSGYRFGNLINVPKWIGNFVQPGQSQVLFYSPGNQNWWLESYSASAPYAGGQFSWTLAGNTKGFGNTAGDPTWIGDYTGSGKDSVLFYSPGDGNWWLGTFNGTNLSWALVGMTGI